MESLENLGNIEPVKYKPFKKEKLIQENVQDSSISNLNINTMYYSHSNNSFIYSKRSQISVFDVAGYILRKQGEMTTMKLHKLLYYCQAWSLVWDEKPLFQEPIEAWAYGPVIRALYSFHKGQFTIKEISIGNPDLLSDFQRDTIDSVLGYYGDKSSQWLIELTHMEDPWRNARKGLSSTERGSNTIEINSLAEYYSSL